MLRGELTDTHQASWQCFLKMKILHHSNETALEKCTENGRIFVKKLRPRKFFSRSKKFFRPEAGLSVLLPLTQRTALPPRMAAAGFRIILPLLRLRPAAAVR